MTVALVGGFVVAVLCAGLGAFVGLRALGTQAEARRRVAAVERALAEAELEQLRLVRAFDEVSEGVVVADHMGRVVYRNRAAERYQGARRSDAVAEDLLGRLMTRAVAGETREQELTLFGPPRSTLLISTQGIEIEGGAVGVVAIVRDVTELRRVEQVRRDFVANVSHELKTPIGALELLAETVASCDDAEVQRRLVHQLVNEADRLARIVDDLLDLSQIEAQEAPNRERLPVRILVDEAVERVRAVALARGIPLRVQPITDDLVVSCDPARVVSALTNLLDNAVKYSDGGGSVEVSVEQGDDRIAVVVTDHGIGIPTSDLERIFERFYRVDKARSRATGGTGLGLSIVRHVAHAHGGEVTVTSREGVGSTFRFILSAAESDRALADVVPEAS